ncbi:hypothetical protein G4B88_024652, partial [Cannabis sativa]
MAPVGIGPVKLLSTSPLKFDRVRGIAPFLRHSGNGPVNLFLLTPKYSRLNPLHRPGGNFPKKLLFTNIKNLKLGLFFPKSLGIVPVKLLLRTENVFKLLRLEMVIGNSPDSWLLLTSKDDRSFRFPISGGMVPTKLFLKSRKPLVSLEISTDRAPESWLILNLWWDGSNQTISEKSHTDEVFEVPYRSWNRTREMFANLLSLEISTGRAPDSWLVLTSKVDRSFRFPIFDGMVPTKLFLKSFKLVRLFRFHKEVGIGPFPISKGIELVKLFLKANKIVKLLSLEILTGKAPDSWLVLTSKIDKSFKFPILGGMVPTKLFLKSCKRVRLLRFHREVGIGPVKWFLERTRLLRFFKFPISKGIEPVKLFAKADNTSNFSSLDMLIGSAPDSWLVLTEKKMRLLRFHIEVGIGPVRLCLSLESFEILDDKCPTNLLSVRLKDWSLMRLENTEFGIEPIQLFRDMSRKVKFLHFDMKFGNVELNLFKKIS